MGVLNASLFEATSALHKTSLYSLIGNLMIAMETEVNFEEFGDILSNFWKDLGSGVSERLGSGLSEEMGYLTDRLVQFVRCLIFPQCSFKAKTDVKVKVKFATTETPSMDSLSTSKPERRELTPGAKKFVHLMTMKSFEMAHKSQDKQNLHLFAALIEFFPEEETIKDIIASCHGDISTDQSHSSYFVFNVCLPWLHQSQELKDSDSGQLINVICSFIPLLETSVIDTLLKELCKV